MKLSHVTTNSVTFHAKVLEAIAAHTKRIKKNKTNKCDLPWLSEECRKLKRTINQLLKKSLKTELNSDRQLFTSARNKVDQVMHKTKANFYLTVIESANGNGEKIWQAINKITGKGARNSNELQLQIKNELVKDPQLFTSTEDFIFPIIENLPPF